MITSRIYKKCIIMFFGIFISFSTISDEMDKPQVVNGALLGLTFKEASEFSAFTLAKEKELVDSGKGPGYRAIVHLTGTTAFALPIVVGFFIAKSLKVAEGQENFDAFSDALEGFTKIYGGLMMHKLARRFSYEEKQKQYDECQRKKDLDWLTTYKKDDGDTASADNEFNEKLVSYLKGKTKKREKSLFNHCFDQISQTGREGLELMVFIAGASLPLADNSFPYQSELVQSLLTSVGIGLAVPFVISYTPAIVYKIVEYVKGSSSPDSDIYNRSGQVCDCGFVTKMLYQYNLLNIFFKLFAGALISYGAHELAEAWHWDVKTWDLIGKNTTSLLDEKQPIGGIISAVVPYDTDPTVEQAAIIIGYWISAFGMLIKGIYENLNSPGDEPCYICGGTRNRVVEVEDTPLETVQSRL